MKTLDQTPAATLRGTIIPDWSHSQRRLIEYFNVNIPIEKKSFKLHCWFCACSIFVSAMLWPFSTEIKLEIGKTNLNPLTSETERESEHDSIILISFFILKWPLVSGLWSLAFELSWVGRCQAIKCYKRWRLLLQSKQSK